MKQAIKIESLSKIYRLGEIGTGTISRDIERFIKTKLLKQEDPFLKIGELNNHSNKGLNDIVYSLKDINFEIEKGDTVGIIGRNGAGKSTLLKILSKITSPSTGKIKIRGRVASLLEVGTGFHPELTGRENIYLNGAILGMRKKEISQKFDEIVDFSGVERYIDTPVKRYSSGMYVRLAFAVAAHLESEILIVDEVLAVGDAEFQKKCIGKMSDISKGDGRTILFVSHNLPAVKSLCRTGCFLEQGELKKVGEINLVLRSYLGGDELINNYSKINAVKNNFQLIEISIRGSKKSLEDPIVRDDKILLEINYINNSDKIVTNNSKEIWEYFKNKLDKQCYDELCWLKNTPLNKVNNSELLIKEIFKPFSPESWSNKPNTWLSSVDIIKIMKQYEKSNSNFKFIGPSPIDFDSKELFSTCVWEQLCNFNLEEHIRNKISKIGVIFNTDPHTKPGQHWIALFLDLDKKSTNEIHFWVESYFEKLKIHLSNYLLFVSCLFLVQPTGNIWCFYFQPNLLCQLAK